MSNNNKKAVVLFASVDEKNEGINLRVAIDGKTEVLFTPKDVWGKIPEDKNVIKELEKITNIFNGYEERADGSWSKKNNFKPININIEFE